jgi:copper oxidase (laccase) domain-containing protein
VIKAEDHKWIVNDKTGGIMPINEYDQAVTYDGIVTGSRDFVLGVQGADCPALFLFDPETRVIGLAHAGWKPVVRGVVRNILDMMEKMGCQLRNIQAFISPGAGDQYNKFQWGERMEPHVENVFVQACRESLLNEMEIRHELSEAEQEILSLAIGRHTGGSTSFKLSALVCQELQTGGLLPEKISKSDHSSIVGRYPVENAGQGIEYRYHSFRREQPIHGLSMSVMFLKQDKD